MSVWWLIGAAILAALLVLAALGLGLCRAAATESHYREE